MKRTALILAAVAMVSVAPGMASAEGALAIGQPKSIARNGVAVGLSVDYNSPASAVRAAMAQCKASKATASTRALCHPVATFANKCVAIAADPKPHTSGFGWAVASTRASASTQALAKCAASAGRKGVCAVAIVQCDRGRKLSSVGSGGTPGAPTPYPPPSPQSFSFARASSSAISTSLAHADPFTGSTALTLLGSHDSSFATGDVTATSSSSAEGSASAGQSSFGSSTGASSSTNGSSCAGAGC